MKKEPYVPAFDALNKLDVEVGYLVDSSENQGELDWLKYTRSDIISIRKNLLWAMSHRDKKENEGE